MSKVLLGLLLGAVLGMIDGATAWFYPYPELKGAILGIVIGSTLKGVVTGLIAGVVARRWQSLPLGVGVGLLVGLTLSFLVAAMPGEGGKHYWLEIMLPGTAVGAIVGFATQRFGVAPRAA